jgi:hypothetical protein
LRSRKLILIILKAEQNLKDSFLSPDPDSFSSLHKTPS